MLITKTTVIDDGDIGASCWARLRRFQNVLYVRDLICELHKIAGGKQKENARKQAESIRYCLQQAKEYADAAEAVSLATKANLAYYSVMSLAVAEVLLKQMGQMYLERMRQEQAHHGLELKVGGVSGGETRLEIVADAMRAASIRKRSGEGFGTFHIWHKSARETPIVGELRQPSGSGSGYISNYTVVYGAADREFDMLPKAGISLIECIQRLPAMAGLLEANGIAIPLVRGTVERFFDPKQKLHRVIFDFQPSNDAGVALQEDIKVRPEDFECVTWNPWDEEKPSLGGQLTLEFKEGTPVSLPVPHCCAINKKQMRFWPGNVRLNEFGFYYVAIYILGNVARYYPDKWLRDVEHATPIALAAERLLSVARDRIPLLALSEMSRIYHVLEAD